MNDVVYFIVDDNGHNLRGCSKIEDIQKALRNNSSKINVYHREFISIFDWNIIKETKGVQEYILKNMPEYMI